MTSGSGTISFSRSIDRSMIGPFSGPVGPLSLREARKVEFGADPKTGNISRFRAQNREAGDPARQDGGFIAAKSRACECSGVVSLFSAEQGTFLAETGKGTGLNRDDIVHNEVDAQSLFGGVMTSPALSRDHAQSADRGSLFSVLQ
jgi:hypothetical protein